MGTITVIDYSTKACALEYFPTWAQDYRAGAKRCNAEIEEIEQRCARWYKFAKKGRDQMSPKIFDLLRDIEKYHTQLVKNYQQLFDQHKEAYGWGDKHLKICG